MRQSDNTIHHNFIVRETPPTQPLFYRSVSQPPQSSIYERVHVPAKCPQVEITRGAVADPSLLSLSLVGFRDTAEL